LTIGFCIAIVVVGHMDLTRIARVGDYALSATAETSLGRFGFVMIAAAALLASSSAINATFYISGRLTYIVAKSGSCRRRSRGR
jgi:amino acid transporter